MIIDAHQHFWKYSAEAYGWIDDSMQILQRDFLPAELASIYGANGIQGSIAVQARQTLEETRWLLSLSESFELIKGVIGWVDLQSTEVCSQLDEFASHHKFKGVRHVVQGEPDDRFMMRESFLNGIRQLKAYDLIYEILILPRHLPAAIELLELFPEQQFVLDHIAKPLIKDGILKPWDDDMRKLTSFPNVCCKVSGMVTEADWAHWQVEDFTPYLDVVFDAFGTDRILFGSDWPVCTVAASYAQVLDIFNQYLTKRNFSQPQIVAVSGQNARKVYRI